MIKKIVTESHGNHGLDKIVSSLKVSAKEIGEVRDMKLIEGKGFVVSIDDDHYLVRVTGWKN